MMKEEHVHRLEKILERQGSTPLPSAQASLVVFEDGDQVVAGLCTHMATADNADDAVLGLIRKLGGTDGGEEEKTHLEEDAPANGQECP